MSFYRPLGRILLLLLLISVALSFVPAYAQQKASLRQQVTVENFGLTRIDLRLSYFNNGSAFTVGPLELRFPGYGPLILNSTVPYTVEGEDLILRIPAFEVPARSEKSVSVTFWLFPFFEYDGGVYRVDLVLVPQIEGADLRSINCTVQLPRGTRAGSLPVGFTEKAPNVWQYLLSGNVTEPLLAEFSHIPQVPYMFANLEIEDMNRRYLYAEDGRVIVEDELWIRLYDDGAMLNSIRVADYLNHRIQVEVGVSDLEYKRPAEGALPLPFPVQRGLNYIKLRYYIEGNDLGQAVELVQPSQPPVIAFVRHASIYLQDRLLAEVSETTSLPKLELSVPKAGPPLASYAGWAVLAAIFFGLLLFFARSKEVTHSLIKRKKAVAMKYLELYEAAVEGLVTKEEFSKQRREIESEKGKVSREISMLREKLVKERKGREAERLLRANRKIEDILKKAKSIPELGRKKKKKALEEIKRLMKELEDVK